MRRAPRPALRPVRLHRVENLTAHEIAAALAEIEEGLIDYYEDEYDGETQSAV